MTETERRLWSRLRNRRIDGYKFRRQVPVGPYFVDFISARLAIEVDGPFHEDESDRRKTARLEAKGYRVLRIPVADIDETLDDVVDGIYLKLSETSLPVRISPPGVACFAGEADLPTQWGGKGRRLPQQLE
jgi:adenine-specific DNA-methyltransferase